jgi:hypothetical protein
MRHAPSRASRYPGPPWPPRTEKLNELMRSLLHASSRILEKALKTLPHLTKERLAGDLASVLQCLEQEESAE